MHIVERIMSPIVFGSKVRLKSGSPTMLVVDIAPANPNAAAAVIVSWLGPNGKPMESTFFISSLDHVRERY